ncbi:MAG TPA: glycosyl hydrolase family 65 protein [Mucilaginibacter sp.]|nr:glycosyl hydrolase family 65 protein [Mucilaginibacter sp.]
MMNNRRILSLIAALTISTFCYAQKHILSTAKLKNYVNNFNSLDTETIKNYVTNANAFNWLSADVPLFECPDSAIEKIYYYRWWTFRKHLVKTPDGYVFTEFITNVKWAGEYNTVSSAVGHQIYEGRWLHDPEYTRGYINFWLYDDPKQKKQHFHSFSSWIDNAVYNFYLVNLDKAFIKQDLPALDKDYHRWEGERQLKDKLFWQYDVKDAMEESISGGRKVQNVRPTINSYMYGNADALAKMAAIAGNDTLKTEYRKKAAQLKKLVQDSLWNDSAKCFEVKKPNGKFADVREELGFIPWYFNLPDDKREYAAQWEQLTNTKGFNAPWGITTAERRSPLFRTHGSGHSCEWDGAVWPYASTQTLKALGNLLTNYKNHDDMSAKVFYDELHKYAMSHIKRGVPYIGEYQDEKTGEWLKEDNPRSKYYNHSGFCDLVISDLIGLKPRPDNVLEVNPLVPQDQWNWFCLDKVAYHGHNITIMWDKNGSKYHRGKGFYIYEDGRVIYHGRLLARVSVPMKS